MGASVISAFEEERVGMWECHEEAVPSANAA